LGEFCQLKNDQQRHLTPRESFSLKTLKKVHFGEQYQLKISNKGAALENLVVGTKYQNLN